MLFLRPVADIRGATLCSVLIFSVGCRFGLLYVVLICKDTDRGTEGLSSCPPSDSLIRLICELLQAA